MVTTPRRPMNAMDAAEALFKPVKKAATPAVERPAIPSTKELVSLKLDSDVVAHFQADGPGWQDRINNTLRAAMKAGQQVFSSTAAPSHRKHEDTAAGSEP